MKDDLAKYGLVCVQLLADVDGCPPSPTIAILRQLPLLHRIVLQNLLAPYVSLRSTWRLMAPLYLAASMIYRSPSQVAQETISELFAIGDSKRGRIHWILSGYFGIVLTLDNDENILCFVDCK